jgi:predicted alpha/beta superfamily hydrolase
MKVHTLKWGIALPVAVLMLILTGPDPVLASDEGDDLSMVVARQFTIDSKVLGESRPVLVNLPRGYEDGEARYPLLIVLDGSPAVTFLARASYFDVTATGFVVAAVPNVDRVRDFSHRYIGDIWPTSGGADRFLAFLTGELLPWLEASFRTTGYRIITGGSAAGNFAVFALLKAPGDFDAAIAQSPMLGTDYKAISELARKCFASEARSEHFLFLVYGSRDYPGVTIYTEKLRQLLQDEAPPWLRFGREVLPEKGHYQFAGLNAGLTALFTESGFPTERFLADGASAVEGHADRLGRRFKTVIPSTSLTSERALIEAANELGRQRRFADATRVLEYGLGLHSDSSTLVYYLAQMLEHASETEEAIAAYRRVLAMEPDSGVSVMTTIFLDNLLRAAADRRDPSPGT